PLRERRLELRASPRDRLAAPVRIAAHALEVRRLLADRRPEVVVGWGTRSSMACGAALRGLRRRPVFVQQGNDLLTGPLIARAAVAIAADRIPELEVTVAGPALGDSGGRIAGELRRRAAAPDLEGRVHLPGGLDDPRGALSDATCLLHCADCEPFGMALV